MKTSATETKAVAKGNVAGTNTVVKASAAGTDAVVNADTGKSRTTASVQRQNMTAREGNTDTGTAGSDQDSTEQRFMIRLRKSPFRTMRMVTEQKKNLTGISVHLG